MSIQVSKRLITAEEYHKMAEVGILQERGLELIDGEIIKMTPIGSRHLSCVNLLNEILSEKLGRKVIISIQNPVRLNEYTEPEPDISILKRTEDRYANQLPSAEDVLLVIEVADSSVDYDRNVKLPLYAESGIPEYWLINLDQKEIEAYRKPLGNAYRFRELLRPGDAIKAREMELEIPVEEVFS
jgi:Uma2 family endonuclease